MKKKERLCFVVISALILWGILSVSCAITPVTAGLSGAIAGAGATMYLDDDPDIILDGEQLVVQGAESNAFSLLEVVVDNIWALALLAAAFWLLPSPSAIRKRFEK